ncbi:L,D-transpeptidase family protein [Flindersiella endophytica]
MRRNHIAAIGAALLAVCMLAGCQGQQAGASGTARDASTASPTGQTSTQATPTTEPTEPETPTSTPTDTPTVTPTVTATPKPKRTEAPKPKAIMEQEDRTTKVRELEARLVQLDRLPKKWLDGYYGSVTRDAVTKFQRDKGLRELGYVDAPTWSKIRSITHTPTHSELYPPVPQGKNTAGALDARCKTGRAICIDKTSRTLRWVIDGQVRLTMDARFGCARSVTREGTFRVNAKVRYGYSNMYDSEMPFSMFFSGDEAVHYSSDFAARGYNGCSHGCVNIRNWNAIERLFGEARVGDKVIVYRS